MASGSASGFICSSLAHNNGRYDVFMHDGRELSLTTDYPRSVNERGFCLVRDVPTKIPMEKFSSHFVQRRLKQRHQMFTFKGMAAVPIGVRSFDLGPDGVLPAEMDESSELVASYQEETANAVKKAFPRAELLVAYNQVLRSSTAGKDAEPAEAKSATKIAQGIIGQYSMLKYFPEDSVQSLKNMLLENDDVSLFLDMVISTNSDKKNPYAQMASAPSDLQAEVREILSNDPHLDFVPRLKNTLLGKADALPDEGAKSADDGNVDAPAVNGIHSDITEGFAMSSLQGYIMPALEDLHTFEARKYTVYHLNLWRNINPEEGIQNYHLAVLDKSSLNKDDAQKRELKFDSYTLEQYALRHNPLQRWFYFPEMKMDEILMFHQGKCLMELDSATAPPSSPVWKFSLHDERHPQSVMHTAVLDPRASAQAQRDSCENRFLVFVPVEEQLRSSL